jgi:hypothetical protein
MSRAMDAPEPTPRQIWQTVIGLVWPLCALATMWALVAVAHV